MNEIPREYQQAGQMQMAAGAINALTSAVWVMAFLVVCVGLLWVVPLLMSLGQAYLGYRMSKGDRIKNPMMVGALGLVAAFFNMNPIPGALTAFGWHLLTQPPAKAYLDDASRPQIG